MVQMQVTHPDFMYDGVQHTVASVFEGYSDTMPGTLRNLKNLTPPPKRVFSIRIFRIESQSDG